MTDVETPAKGLPIASLGFYLYISRLLSNELFVDHLPTMIPVFSLYSLPTQLGTSGGIRLNAVSFKLCK